MARILVADDEQDLRDALQRVFERDGHEVLTASDGFEAVERVRNHSPELVVLDNRMPRLSGLDALARIREFNQEVVAVLFTAYDDAVDVRRAILELGAYGYLTKSSGVEGTRTTIQQALRSRGLSSPRKEAAQRPERTELDFGGMVGQSPQMEEIFRLIDRIRHSDVTVLIQGESGTGKELVARAIHERSLRASGPYVTVDCGTLPDTLTESEIFGYEAGAFTDARKSRPGRLEMAHGGTIFLDEIGNLSHGAQAKLLRVLEDKRITRLGGTDVKEIDVRIVAATNVQLHQASREGTFREDLYYRLNVFKLSLPPLRERREDLHRLAGHFLADFSAEQGKELPGGLTPEAAALLEAHSWPGNVRELRNVMERAVLLAEGQIAPADLPSGLGEGFAVDGDAVSAPPAAGPGPSTPVEVDLDRVPLKEAKRQAAEAVEQAYLLAALRRTGWNKARAARLLGLNYKTLREKVREHDLERERFRE